MANQRLPGLDDFLNNLGESNFIIGQTINLQLSLLIQLLFLSVIIYWWRGNTHHTCVNRASLSFPDNENWSILWKLNFNAVELIPFEDFPSQKLSYSHVFDLKLKWWELGHDLSLHRHILSWVISGCKLNNLIHQCCELPNMLRLWILHLWLDRETLCLLALKLLVDVSPWFFVHRLSFRQLLEGDAMLEGLVEVKVESAQEI